jgi:hypothetical protein
MVKSCSECVGFEYRVWGKRTGLTVVLDVCVVNIVMGKGNWG